MQITSDSLAHVSAPAGSTLIPRSAMAAQNCSTSERPEPHTRYLPNLRTRGKIASVPKSHSAAVHGSKARSKVAHASSRSHRSKPSLLARLITRPFKDLGKAFRVSQRKTYRTASAAY